MTPAAHAAAPASDLKIAKVEVFRVRLPYKSQVAFKAVKQSKGEYALLRLTLDNGLQGLAETICRPEQSGEDATSIAYQISTFLAPILHGADPLAHLAILDSLRKIRDCNTSKCLIDIALWDLRGKILGLPVWRLLGSRKGQAHTAVLDCTRQLCRSPGCRGA